MGRFRLASTRRARRAGTTEESTISEPVDRFLGDGELAAAHATLLDGDWRPANALLGGRPDCWRSQRALSDATVPIDLIETWHADSPAPRTQTLLAHALINYGWTIRADIERTDDASVADHERIDPADFERVMAQAETMLLDLAEATPSDPEPHAMLVTTGMVARIGQAAVLDRFEEANRRAAFHPPAVAAAVQALSPRWGGSVIGVKRFAQRIVDEAPDGSPALGSVVAAQLAIAEDRRDDDSVSISSVMQEPENVQQAQTALARMLGPIHGVAPTDAVPELNQLLCWVRPTDRASAVLNRRGFEALDSRATSEPWERFGSAQPLTTEAFTAIEAERLAQCMTLSREPSLQP